MSWNRGLTVGDNVRPTKRRKLLPCPTRFLVKRVVSNKYCVENREIIKFMAFLQEAEILHRSPAAAPKKFRKNLKSLLI